MSSFLLNFLMAGAMKDLEISVPLPEAVLQDLLKIILRMLKMVSTGLK